MAKALFLSGVFFLYVYAPAGFFPRIPGTPHSLYVGVGVLALVALVYNPVRWAE